MKGWVLLLGLLLPGIAEAAPRTPYGGAVVGYVWGRPIATRPEDLATPADATVQRCLYEPLYRIDEAGALVPNLAAALPEMDETTVKVQLRPDLIAHDGTPVDARQVASWLNGLLRPDSRAAFVLLPVAGARARLAGAGTPVGIQAVGPTTLLFDLAYPHPRFGRLLASAHAGIGVSSGAGTGPFQLGDPGPKGGVTLLPFTGHYVGRPFLARVELRPLASRFGATAIIRRERAGLVFGVPDTSRIDDQHLLPWPKEAHHEVLVLSAGDRLDGDRRALVAALDGALNRRRLARRYLDQNATATETFLGIAEHPLPGGSPGRSRSATLLVAKEARAGQRFAERVQLDLHRAGVTAVIDRVSSETLERRRRSRDYELMLDVVLPDGPGGTDPVDRLHGLLSIGASYGRADFVSAETLERFFSGDRKLQERLLPEIEQTLRAEGVLPIAARPPAVSVLADLRRLDVRPAGALDLADVFLYGEPE